jgi:hypothetical protein
LANFDNQFAGSRLRSREHRQGVLRHESANDAIVVARRATAMIAALAGGAVMVRVLVRGGMVDGRCGEMVARMAMAQAAQRAGQHVANGQAAGDSAMVAARDHEALGSKCNRVA